MQSRSQQQLAQELDISLPPFVSRRLNPANDELGCPAIPDGSSQPSFTQQFKNQRIFSSASIPNFAGSAWHMDVVLFAHPIVCYSFHMWDDEDHHYYGVQLNAQLSVQVSPEPENWTMQDYFTLTNAFRSQCEQYRVVYTGLTGNMVSSDMFNAGALSSAQYVWLPADMAPFNEVANISSSIGRYSPLAKVFSDTLRSYTQLCQQPGAYSNDAKYGFYIPLKIFDTEYRRTNNLVVYDVLPATQDMPAWVDRAYQNSQVTTTSPSAPLTAIGSTQQGVIPGTAASTFFPFGGMMGNTGGIAGSDYLLLFNKQWSLPMSSYYMGQVSMRNLSSEAQFYFTFRSGYQMVTTPGSMFMQYVNYLSPYSPEELVIYSAMVSQLPDCFPDSYNDWGKLKGYISKAWQIVRIFLPTHVRDIGDTLIHLF